MIDDELEKKIVENDTNIAVDFIRRCYIDSEDLIAILLCGGYGRGEGAWYKDPCGNLHTYNDYDFAVIAKSSISGEDYESLRSQIAKAVDIRWVDIDFYKPSHFKHVAPTIKNVDLINAYTLLFGNDNLVKNSSVNPKRIGKSDIITLYRTRLWTFLGSWTGGFRDLNEDDSRFFKNQMAKAILAACDMLLIHIHGYTPLYKNRVALVCERYADDKGFCETVNWALNEKLNPSGGTTSKKEMEFLYWTAKDIFCKATQRTLPSFWNSLMSPKKTKHYLIAHDRLLLKDAYRKIILKTNIAEKMTDVFCAQNLVFFANDRGTINKTLLDECSIILKKWNYINHESADWNYLRERVAWARNNL